MQAVETCVPAPAHCSSPFAFAHLCKQVNVNICVNFFARQNPHLVHTSATCYECQRNFDPNVAHFVPISFRVNATPNETDYIQGRRTSPSSSWTSVPDGEPLGLVHDLLGRAHGRSLLHSTADVKPERQRRFPGLGRTEQPSSSSKQPCGVRGDLEDERRAGGRRRPGLVGRAGVWMILKSNLQFHHRNELIVNLNTVTANSAFIFKFA